MLTFKLKDCKECSQISSTVEQISKKILLIQKDNYRNLVFGLDYKIDKQLLLRLIYYKDLLINMMFTRDYTDSYTTEEIVSKAKNLLNK